MHCVSTGTGGNYKNKFGLQSKNLASIIRGFKIGVTKNARKAHVDFKWQARFHDHIIRNDESYHRIKNYICNNPTTWVVDKFHNEF
jgi:putative transposase